ncbi:MAG TPA: hypothetical protein VGL33_20715 [Streptosporangiaceae bacterium]|jgi:hypothetical protein
MAERIPVLVSGSWVVNPDTVDIGGFDDGTRGLLRAVIEWFEGRHPVEQFLGFARKAGLFADCLIPAVDGPAGHRWDTARNEAVSEILGFYSPECWRIWQEAVFGVVPVWLSGNREERARLADFLQAGGVPAAALGESTGTAPQSDAAFIEEAIGGSTFTGAALGAGGRMLHQAVNRAHAPGTGGRWATDSPAVRKVLGEAYLRLVAGKLFAVRASAYLRSVDRRHLLFAAVGREMAITESGRVDRLLREFSVAGDGDVAMFPGRHDVTAILRFAESYLLHPASFDPVPAGRGPSDDSHLFQRQPAASADGVRFHNWRPSFDAFADHGNVGLFREQVEQLCSWVARHPREATRETVTALGDLFVLVVYGHLILEQADFDGVSRDVVDGVSGLLAGDFSARLLDIQAMPAASPEQREWARAAVRAPAGDAERVWPRVEALVGEYSPRR